MQGLKENQTIHFFVKFGVWIAILEVLGGSGPCLNGLSDMYLGVSEVYWVFEGESIHKLHFQAILRVPWCGKENPDESELQELVKGFIQIGDFKYF